MFWARFLLALAERGEQVAVVLPAYRENRYPQPTREAYRNLWIPIGPGYNGRHSADCDPKPGRRRRHVLLRASAPRSTIATGIYGSPAGDFPDNHVRFAVLSMAAIGVARHLFRPDILHLHDWQAGAYARLPERTLSRRSDISRREDAPDHS